MVVTLKNYLNYLKYKNLYSKKDKKDKKYKKEYRSVYFKYLNDVFTIAFGENHGFNTKDIYYCEIDLLNTMSCNLIKKEDENGYNLVSKKEALEILGLSGMTLLNLERLKPLYSKKSMKDI